MKFTIREKILAGILCLIILARPAGYLMATIGDVFDSVMVDSATGVVQNNYSLTFSNSIVMGPAPSASNHLARIMDVTNAVVLAFPVTINHGGTSTNTTQLTGTWTNTGQFTILGNQINNKGGVTGVLTNAGWGDIAGNNFVHGTNNAAAYQVLGVTGFTGVVSNMSAVAGVTNVEAYLFGLITNKFTIP